MSSKQSLTTKKHNEILQLENDIFLSVWLNDRSLDYRPLSIYNHPSILELA